MNFMDIYYSVDTNLLENDYYKNDINGQIKLIDKFLKEYAISKILEIDSSKQKLIEENTTVNQLVKVLSEIIPKEKHFDTIRHFTHYILNAASNLQGFSILWMVEKDNNLIEKPIADFNIEDMWESLTTHEETSYLTTFEFVYDTFQNKFMSKNYRQPIKLLIQ